VKDIRTEEPDASETGPLRTQIQLNSSQKHIEGNERIHETSWPIRAQSLPESRKNYINVVASE